MKGSVQGPKLSINYMSLLGNIICKHGLEAHFYADDTQIYFSFEPENYDAAIIRVELCIQETCEWMANNLLKLNDDKTRVGIGLPFPN